MKKRPRPDPNRASDAFKAKVLEGFLNGKTAAKIADETGRTREGVRKVQRTEWFKDAVRDQREEWIDHTKSVLDGLGLMAAGTLLAGMSGTRSRVAMECADSVLDRIGAPRAKAVSSEAVTVGVGTGLSEGEGVAEVIARAKARLAAAKASPKT